jgi:hypothetical protein
MRAITDLGRERAAGRAIDAASRPVPGLATLRTAEAGDSNPESAAKRRRNPAAQTGKKRPRPA